MAESAENEEQLLKASLAGDKDSFGLIVKQYQSLICSITYCSTGNLSKSEELAQDTFLTAWRQLKQLRDLNKFRGWLCTIARNLARKAISQRNRDIISNYQTIDDKDEIRLQRPGPSEAAISKEQQEIVWSALKGIPEKYREPIVLFYRKQQSVREVAEELELTEEATRQRLARGRQMLRKQVAAMVEDTLGRTNPGEVFTAAIIAALPASIPQAAGAFLGATAVKGSIAAKLSFLLNLIGAILGHLLGLIGMIIGLRATVRDAKSSREGKFQKKVLLIALLFGLILFLIPFIPFIRKFTGFNPPKWFVPALLIIYLAGVYLLAFIFARQRKKIQIEEGTYLEPEQRSKQRSAGSIIGSFSGGIVGSLLWLYMTAFMAKDWIALWIILIAAVTIFLIAVKWCLREKEKFDKISLIMILFIGLIYLVIINLRWKSWIKYFSENGKYSNYTHVTLLQMNLLIISAIGILLLFFAVWELIERRKRQKN